MQKTILKAVAPLTAGLFLFAATGYAQVSGTIITTKGGTVSGTIRWLPTSKQYEVTQPSGISMPVSEMDVQELRIAKPADLDRAIRMVDSGQASQAIPILQRITTDYYKLQWDVIAAGHLANSYAKSGDLAKAGEMADKMVSSRGMAEMDERLISVYWDWLLSSKKLDKLKKSLDDAITSGNRSVAAVALIKRGDMKKQEGNLKEALVDGYLRAAWLYESEKDILPEALYKAAKAFEERNEMSHVQKMRNRLLTEFPNDPYTKKIQSGS